MTSSPALEFFNIIRRMVRPLSCTIVNVDEEYVDTIISNDCETLVIHIYDKTDRGLSDRSLFIEWRDESITIKRKNNHYSPYLMGDLNYHFIARHNLCDPDSINKVIQHVLCETSTAINHFDNL